MHVRLLELVSVLFLFLFSGLGFRACMCTHAYCMCMHMHAYYMRTHTQSMRMCTTGLCMHTRAQKT